MAGMQGVAPVVREYIEIVGSGAPAPDVDVSLDALSQRGFSAVSLAVTEGCRILSGTSDRASNPDDYFAFAVERCRSSYFTGRGFMFLNAQLAGCTARMLQARTERTIVDQTKRDVLDRASSQLHWLLGRERNTTTAPFYEMVAERVALAGLSAIGDNRVLGLPAPVPFGRQQADESRASNGLVVASSSIDCPPYVQIEDCLTICGYGSADAAQSHLGSYGPSTLLLARCCDLSMWGKPGEVSLRIARELGHRQSTELTRVNIATARELGAYLFGVLENPAGRLGTMPGGSLPTA